MNSNENERNSLNLNEWRWLCWWIGGLWLGTSPLPPSHFIPLVSLIPFQFSCPFFSIAAGKTATAQSSSIFIPFFIISIQVLHLFNLITVKISFHAFIFSCLNFINIILNNRLISLPNELRGLLTQWKQRKIHTKWRWIVEFKETK